MFSRSMLGSKLANSLINLSCATLTPINACQAQLYLLPLLIPARKTPTIRFYNDGKFLKANDSSQTIAFYSPYRASRYIWPDGIQHIYDRMLTKYLVTTINNKLEGAVIDIGANIGEFSLAMAQKTNSTIYAFEPDPIALACLKENTKNIHNIKINDKALSENPGIMPYYTSSRRADSSLIKPTEKYTTTNVSVNTLDCFITEQNISHIELIKLEAEGAEPEIIRGSGKALEITKAIAVDISPEREGQSTENEVRELLLEKGFKITKASFESLHAINKNLYNNLKYNINLKNAKRK